MDVLWDSPTALTANELRDCLLKPPFAADKSKPLATTTVLTVLSRLEAKKFVARDRTLRPHSYSAVMSRAAHTAGLMHDVLGQVPDRQAALARFIGDVTPEEAETLRRLLGVSTTPPRSS